MLNCENLRPQQPWRYVKQC